MRTNQLVIHNDAILHNLALIKKLTNNSKILPMIKANAFGHGLLNVANLLSDHVDALAVARFEEAMEVMAENPSLPLVLMSGEIDLEKTKKLIQLNCHIVISTQHQYLQLVNAKINGKTTVWLKINTGMNRLGISPLEADAVIHKLRCCSWVEDIVLMTHLSDADLPSNLKTNMQVDALRKISTQHSLAISIANSAAIVQHPNSHGDWVRPGVMLYGGSPIPSMSSKYIGLKPTMTLYSFILDIRRQYKNDEIGYSSSWVCDKDMLLGIIPLGYGDGYPRNINSHAFVWVNNTYCPIVGRVSMDLITIDVSQCKNLKIGDRVEMWGENVSIDEVAGYAGTIANEIMTHISPRLVSTTVVKEEKNEK